MFPALVGSIYCTHARAMGCALLGDVKKVTTVAIVYLPQMIAYHCCSESIHSGNVPLRTHVLSIIQMFYQSFQV
jgi:hypothetical protein